MGPDDGITTTTGPSRVRAWVLAFLLGAGSLCVLFDSLAVATALPAIGRDLDLGAAGLQWVVSLYSVTIGALILLGGRSCDVLGPRRVLAWSLLLCAAGGLVAGLAPTSGMLLVGRVVQGAAAAGAVPAALSLASRAFPEEPCKSRVYSVIAMSAWLAAVAGAVLGGLITSTWGWRWVFLVTVPVAAAAAVGTARLRIPATSPVGGTTLDARGAALVCAGLAALLVGVDRLGHQAWLQGGLVLCAGVALVSAFVVTERRSASPLVPTGLLASKSMIGACLAFGAYCAGYVAVVVVTSLLLQERYGLSAAGTGSLLVPMLVTGTVSAVVAPRVVRRLGARRVTVAALTTCAVAMAGLALSRPDGPLLLVPWLVLWGVGSGPVFVGLTREVLGDAAPGDSGAVAAVFESMSHVGGGVAASAYLTLLAVGAGFGLVQAVAAAAVATGAVLAAVVMPRSGTGSASAAVGQDVSRPARRRAA